MYRSRGGEVQWVADAESHIANATTRSAARRNITKNIATISHTTKWSARAVTEAAVMVMVMVMEDVTTVTAMAGPLWVVTVGPLWVANINSEKAPFEALFSFFRNFAAISSYTKNNQIVGGIIMSYLSGKEERMWAVIVHLSALIGFIIPLGNVLGPLIVWLVKREEGAFFDAHGKEALNFNISVTIYAAISSLLLVIFIGALLLIALFLFWIILVVMAAVKTNEGKAFQYPLIFRFIK